MRHLLSVLLFAAAVSFSTVPASAATGVAFVHGTGHQTNAAADYWGWGFINSVRQGLPNQANYTVINCDFTRYMWDNAAAGCLALAGTGAATAQQGGPEGEPPGVERDAEAAVSERVKPRPVTAGFLQGAVNVRVRAARRDPRDGAASVRVSS